MARPHFDEQLKELNQEMIHMGMLCETAIKHASEAVLTHNLELAGTLPDLQDQLNQNDKEIESISMRILLQQQPVARDLRYVSSAQKMVTDMKRIGVQSADIAEIVTMDTIKRVPDDLPIRPMANAVIHMVSSSIDAFVKKDERLARDVIAYDDKVDAYFNEIRHKLTLRLQHQEAQNNRFSSMQSTATAKQAVSAVQVSTVQQEGIKQEETENRAVMSVQPPESVDYGAMILDLLMVAKYLERIGDHAVNIAGWVCYSVTGVREGVK